MSSNILSVRELEPKDVEFITDYWLNADREFLHSMGADIEKIPARPELSGMIAEQLDQAYPDKRSYCIIWELDGKPIGHCNTNKINFGEAAYMHLHIWNIEQRKKGIGTDLVKMTIPYFFKNLKLKKLCCEPYALNPAPNKTLEKTGFELVKNYVTIPGYLNFEQEVNLWEMSLERYNALFI